MNNIQYETSSLSASISIWHVLNISADHSQQKWIVQRTKKQTQQTIKIEPNSIFCETIFYSIYELNLSHYLHDIRNWVDDNFSNVTYKSISMISTK